MSLNFNNSRARAMNSAVMEIVRKAMLSPDAADPVTFCTNMLHKAVSGSAMDKVMAVPLLTALLHYSLRAVTKEKFIAEFEIALDQYTDYMEKEAARIGPISAESIIETLMKLG